MNKYEDDISRSTQELFRVKLIENSERGKVREVNEPFSVKYTVIEACKY